MADFDPRNAGNLTAHFDASRRIPPAELVEQTRHNYYTAAQMQKNGDPTIGGLSINTSGRTDMDYPGSDNQKKRERDERMLALMIHNMTLQQIEDQLAARYGENFAENLAAEYLSEDSYKRLMSIEDKTERRRQIAVELNQGIRNGSIDADKILGNSDFEGWLHAHDMEEQRMLQKSRGFSQNDTESNHPHSNDAERSRVENAHTLTKGTDEESAFNAIFANKGPTVK
jgi:hypothetical protein